MRLTKIISLLMLSLLLGAGCNPSHQPDQKKELSSMRELQPEEKSVNQSFEKEAKIPLEINESLFHSVADWKDNETLLYITNDVDGSEIHTYNLFTGKSSLFFESQAPIVQFEANANHTLFFVHTSPTSYEAELTILDTDGKVKFSTKIESYELQYTWNQINHNQLFISSFSEDWTFQTYMLNVDENDITKNPVDFPFIQWLNDKEISYLKWDQETPSITAPLYIYNIENQKETQLANGVVSNSNFNQVMSTFELVDDNGTAVVRFYDLKSKSKLTEMPTRLVALYSEWSIPYHDMDSKENIFYMFEVNEAKTSFSLISFNLETQEKQTIIETIENLPFKLSPNGEYALYGARYEHIIHLEDKAIKELVKLK
ncbi:hypothetical protein [Metabacillus litoralis]|uniref:YqgU-like 6-bladed beta-propeller domain-containing protein n=1 Tax=Metabacillus litoralis TaxID=152268 RepID=A0A179STG1_9BACI|nr:hypothetical protein [Metabacillus litoralis]OAS85086.1 hypothetical protein A6K24_06125 [Metabacillus litoralis]